MSASQGIYWSEGENTEFLSYVPGVDLKPKKMNPRSKKLKGSKQKRTSTEGISHREDPASTSRCTATSGSSKTKNKSGSADSSFSSKSQRASLKDLCPEDKKRVANLVRELAKAGEDKEATENLLNDERKRFDAQLHELKADKVRIEQEQKSILAQFNECQKLLVFYQKKIADEQKEVARDISRLLSESPLSKSSSTGLRMKPSPKQSPRYPAAAMLDDDVTVREIEEGIPVPLSSRNYAPNSGNNVALGQGFRRTEENRKILQSPLQSNFPPQLVVVGRDKSPGRRPNFLNDSASVDPNLNTSSSSDTMDAARDHEEVQRFTTSDSTSEDYVKGKPNAFERRLRSESPNGRREALIKQKRELEFQQAHLQQLLVEQENLLKFRQSELMRRRDEYDRRRGHFKRHGAPLPQPTNVLDDISQLETSTGQTSDSYQANAYTAETTPMTSSPQKDTSTPLKSFLNDTSRFNYTSAWPESFQQLQGVQDPYAEASHKEPKLPSLQSVVVGRSPTTHSAKDPDTTVASPISGTRSSDKYLRGNSSFEVSSTTSQSRSHNCDACYKQSVQHLSTSDRDSLRQRPNKSSRDPAKEGSSPGNYVKLGRRDINLGHNSRDNTLTEEELLSSSFTNTRRSTHSKMNNISLLSDLVLSDPCTDTMYSLKPDRNSLSILEKSNSTDHDVTTTFDPEDSQLLEDIFFIN